MSLFMNNDSFYNMEKKLENALLERKRDNRVISDIEFTKEDYDILSDKYEEGRLYSNYEYITKYRLCPLVLWVFGIREFSDTEDVFDNIRKVFDNMAQHMSKRMLRMYSDTFNEYGIDCVIGSVDNVDEFIMELIFQAGFTKEEVMSLCNIFSDRINQYSRSIYDADMPVISKRIENLRNYVEKRYLGRVMITMQKLYADIYVKQASWEEACRNHPTIPVKIVYNMWDIISEKGEDKNNEQGKCC